MKQFIIIFIVIFLLQLPNMYFILGRDAGGIDDFGNENWIVVSDWMSTIFSFPIYYFVKEKINSYGLAFLIYMVDLAVISAFIHFGINGIRKMKILTIIMITSIVFSISGKSQDRKYFEGIIIYTIDYKNLLDPNDNPFGDTLVVYSKNGLLRRNYSTKQLGGISVEIIDPYKGMIYMELVGNDTVYWYDIKHTSPYTTLTKASKLKSDVIILENKCDMLTTQILSENNELSFKTDEKYFYSSTLKVDPLWFKNYKYGYSDKIFELIKAHYLKYEAVTPATALTITATDIKEVSLGDSLFKIDMGKPLVEYKVN